MAELGVRITHELDELTAEGVRAITAAVESASRELRETHIPAEAPRGDTGALGSDWHETERDALTRVVYPQDDAWYAHIVAGGRRRVRPTRRRALTIDGQFRANARAVAGNAFHERAIATLEGRVDELLADALADQGVA